MTLPKGVHRVESAYDRVWVIERIYADNDDAADIAAVNKLQDRITAVPLSKYPLKNWTPPAPTVPDTTVNDPGLPVGMAYYDKLGELLAEFPPPAADQPQLERLAAIGVGAGRTPSTNSSLNADVVAGMTQAIADGPTRVLGDIQALYGQGFAAHNGYLVTPTGAYGTDYRLRAAITQAGLGALTAEQAIYPLALTDRLGAVLHGDKKYVVHVPAGELPPVNAFWSLTMYDNQGFLVDNEIDRYLVNDRTDLVYNPDGSLDLYIQSTRPTDPAKAANWLPSPGGRGFRVIWRLYATQTDQIAGVLDGTGWRPPAILPVA